jgi:predicted amidophosphoribosyltransferase
MSTTGIAHRQSAGDTRDGKATPSSASVQNDASLSYCASCGRPTVPVKQLALEALAEGHNVSAAARIAKCSRQYVQALKRRARPDENQLALALIHR